MPPNYDNGKIYRILCPDGHFYIGSTVSTLSVRMNTHKQKSKIETSRLYTHVKSNNGWDGVIIELLEEYPCTTARELTAREDYYIRSHKSNPKCLNENRSHVTPEERIEAQKKYYEEHKEEIIEYHRKYTEQNREQVDAYQAQYRLENAEKRRAYSRQYAKDHPEEKKARRRQHYQENKEHVYQKCKEYNEAHKDEVREYKTKWSRNKRAEGAEDRKKKALARKEATAAKRAYEATVVQCECGGSYRNDRKARHYATHKHTKFLESQNVSKPQNEVVMPDSEPEPAPKPVTKRPRKIKILEA
jgi:hypothetical protein